MPTFTWWIDEPLIRGSPNPTDEDLQALRADGFTIAVSLLVETIQPPRYQQPVALSAGWDDLFHSYSRKWGSIDRTDSRVHGATPRRAGAHENCGVLSEREGPHSMHGRGVLDCEMPHDKRSDYTHEQSVFSYRLDSRGAAAFFEEFENSLVRYRSLAIPSALSSS